MRNKRRARRGRAKPRRRRTSEEARRVILEAAERRLIDHGPDGLRLKDIAGDVGISHPAVLHHFGNREALLASLAAHALERLRDELIEQVLGARSDPGRSVEQRTRRTAEMLDRSARLLEDRGYARVLAWLALANRKTKAGRGVGFQPFVEALHQGRLERARARKSAVPTKDDTRLGSLMVVLVLLGDALFGGRARAAIGISSNARARRHFHAWFAAALEAVPPILTDDR